MSCVRACVCVCVTGLGGITYWLTIFPVDCIKSAMQTDSIIKSQRKYTTMLTTAKVRELRADVKSVGIDCEVLVS